MPQPEELIKMLDIVMGAAAALVAAVMAAFLILLAINIALVRKLRAIIPPAPQARPGVKVLESVRDER